MGNSIDTKIQYDETEWEEVHGKHVFRNKKTGIEAHQYQHVLWQSEDLSKQVNLFNYRTNSQHNYPKLHAVGIRKQSIGICASTNHVTVLTEKMAYLACDIKTIDMRSLEIMLYNCFKGFRWLKNRFGSLEINEKMIAVSQDGQTKVWLSSNYARNCNEIDASFIRQTERTEKKMILKLMNIFQPKLEPKSTVPMFDELRKTDKLKLAIEIVSSRSSSPVQILQSNHISLETINRKEQGSNAYENQELRITVANKWP